MKDPLRRFIPAALVFLLVLTNAACGSLGPCDLYGCPRIDVRGGPDCREAWLVNPGTAAKIYSLRRMCGGSGFGPVPGDPIARDQVVAPGEEIFLGCLGGWDLDYGCWYDLFDVMDAPAAAPARPLLFSEKRRDHERSEEARDGRPEEAE